VLNDGDTARIAVLVAKPVEDPLRGMPLLSRPTFIRRQDPVDDPSIRIQLRTRRRSAPSVPGGHRKRQHLRYRPRVDPKAPRRFPPAHTFNLNRKTNLSVKLHALHPSAPAAFRQRPSLPDFYSGATGLSGRFSEGFLLRRLQLLDLEAFRHIFVQRASFFDPDFRGLRDKAYFLGRLVSIMSRPVMPSDEDFQYLPTQAVAEYLSEKIEPRLDGLIFPSSQRDGAGENVVLFRRASTVEPDNTDNMEFNTH